MISISILQSINDTYGHDAGDDVLREFAVRIRKSIRGIDLACAMRRGVVIVMRKRYPGRRMVAERCAARSPAKPLRSQGTKRIDVTIRSGWRRWNTRTSRSPTCSSAPTWRSIGKQTARNRVVSTARDVRLQNCTGPTLYRLFPHAITWSLASPSHSQRLNSNENGWRRHLALRHHHAGHVALRRDPPLRARRPPQ